jgi:hypothetical protein
MPEELKKLLQQVHNGITIFDFDGKSVPCIILEERKYDELLSKVAGKSLSIDTDLNILQDGKGHVFVEVTFTFSQGGIVEKILVNANKDILFFQSLAKTSMLALSSPKSSYGKDNVFMIQLPKPEKAKDALKIIERDLKQSDSN